MLGIPISNAAIIFNNFDLTVCISVVSVAVRKVVINKLAIGFPPYSCTRPFSILSDLAQVAYFIYSIE